jgi:choline kinase
MIVDRDWRDETMKVIIADDRVVQMSKKISRDQYSGTYIGVATFRKAAEDKFFGKMEDLISRTRQRVLQRCCAGACR